ncbi:sensor histidine kinase [Nocardiopsis halophila]|uniref:sensor histidine kinase n=1 Tax=Nocardiopsis halophila TaxID=141692 RepID=UPI0003495F68|nr:histidine kinase [Nocardiopsis halophila]
MTATRLDRSGRAEGPERFDEAQGQLHKANSGIVFGSISAVGALLVAIEADSLQHGLLLGPGVGTALVVMGRWNAGRFSFPRVALPGLLVTAVVWITGVLAVDSPTSAYGFAIVATITVLELPHHRRAAIAGTAAVAATAIGAKLVMGHEGAEEVLLRYVLVSVCIALGGVVLAVLVHAVHGLMGELEKAREREADLAVMRERVRFAGDLHDIQGHTLHVVKLKVTLAKRLLHSDVERAEEELDEVHALVGETITETKELAYAQRRLNLAAELENAKNLFEAAGIRVQADRVGDVDARAGELLGQVLREATTNILRHAEAERVWITVTESGITVANDGVREGGSPSPELSGLAVLRERLASEGGVLTVEVDEGVFRTSASFPRALGAAGGGGPERPEAVRR